MSEGTLFGNRITPDCQYCEFSVPTGRKGFLLCSKKGVVSSGFSCRHYRYDPVMRIPRRPLELEAYRAEDFSLLGD